MNKLFICFLLAISCISCKNKKTDNTPPFFPVIDYLRSEVKKMDSLPLTFTKITTTGDISDTSKTTKEEFNKHAKEFVNLPDIASADKRDDYKETQDFDEIMNNVLLIYTPKKPDDFVRNETVMLPPDDEGNTHVKTILITTVKNDKDSTIEKNMTWHMDKRFQIVTKVNKPNQPEKINILVISWE